MRLRKKDKLAQATKGDDVQAGQPATTPTAAATPAATSAGIPQNLPDLPVDTGTIVREEAARATRRAVARALAEDLGDRGDVTSLATIEPTRKGFAELVARQSGVFAGADVARTVFAQVDARIEITFDVADGDAVREGQVIATVAGPLRSILTAERTALNFVCHLSGIATRTREVVDLVASTGVAVRDTRKTTPGLRLLEKAAVKAGGGSNHRLGLYDALLVKDNHVAAAGSIEAAIDSALERARGKRVQVEVDDLDQLRVALDKGVTDIMLDNFTPQQCVEAVGITAGRARLEASGTITRDNILQYAGTGVDRIAMGSITHSAAWLDLGLDVRPAPVEPRPQTVLSSTILAPTAGATIADGSSSADAQADALEPLGDDLADAVADASGATASYAAPTHTGPAIAEQTMDEGDLAAAAFGDTGEFAQADLTVGMDPAGADLEAVSDAAIDAAETEMDALAETDADAASETDASETVAADADMDDVDVDQAVADEAPAFSDQPSDDAVATKADVYVADDDQSSVIQELDDEDALDEAAIAEADADLPVAEDVEPEHHELGDTEVDAQALTEDVDGADVTDADVETTAEASGDDAAAADTEIDSDDEDPASIAARLVAQAKAEMGIDVSDTPNEVDLTAEPADAVSDARD